MIQIGSNAGENTEITFNSGTNIINIYLIIYCKQYNSCLNLNINIGDNITILNKNNNNPEPLLNCETNSCSNVIINGIVTIPLKDNNLKSNENSLPESSVLVILAIILTILVIIIIGALIIYISKKKQLQKINENEIAQQIDVDNNSEKINLQTNELLETQN